MINIIIKDFKYVKKVFIIIIAYVAFLSIFFFAEDTIMGMIMLYMLIPFFSVTMLLDKICMEEDKMDTRVYLKLLPYSNLTQVGTKFLEVIIILICSSLYIFCYLFIVVPEINIIAHISTLCIILLLLLDYFSLYLVLYYIKGYYATKMINFIIFIFFMLFIGIFNRYKGLRNIDFNIMTNLSWFWIFVAVSILIACILFKAACWGNKRRILS